MLRAARGRHRKPGRPGQGVSPPGRGGIHGRWRRESRTPYRPRHDPPVPRPDTPRRRDPPCAVRAGSGAGHRPIACTEIPLSAGGLKHAGAGIWGRLASRVGFYTFFFVATSQARHSPPAGDNPAPSARSWWIRCAESTSTPSHTTRVRETLNKWQKRSGFRPLSPEVRWGEGTCSEVP